ncbi:hypothetical protein GOD47_01405 [Sinorhizobium medicae]|nr:hypothetical protein [Sinorhizobium medicae]MDX0662673.1 hypothetical protein [Sinorhizobium medicae]MDX0723722.1 hypothetical protein [Sinorhizobium medicae]MDX0729798.1 hypothetical protein [Sinorhizobium medicae]MDX0809887.1 hypothetical protein [Sinorhizobium medicae]
MRMALLLISLSLAVPAFAADGFSTLDEFQADFATATPCRPFEGRKLWKGKEAFYIQSWLFYTGQSGLLDDESASVIIPSENTPKVMAQYVSACK